MASVYLYFNAVLYGIFAFWCTIAPAQTAKAVGYDALSRSGESEYLVVYGGLQLGLAIFFFYCARAGEQRTGLILALAVYAPLVLYRIVTVARHWPVTPTTLGTGLLEIALLLGGLAAWWRLRA